MRRTAFLCLMLVGLAPTTTAPAGADETAHAGDGLYYVAPSGAGVEVVVGGQRVAIGGRYPHPVKEAVLVSRDNANRQYDLRLTTGFEDQGLRRIDKLLIVEGRHLRSRGSGSSGGTESYLSFRVDAGGALAAVERHFGIQAVHRRHPGHALRVSFVVPPKPFLAGKPMEVELEIENVGRESIVYVRGGQNRGPRDNQFSFSARGGPGDKAVPDTGDATNFGGISGPVPLAPGETHRQRVDVSKWFAFVPGTYVVLGSYALTFHDPSATERTAPLWEDHATAHFVLTVA